MSNSVSEGQCELGKALAFVSVGMTVVLAAVFWTPMVLGYIEFSGLLLFAPTIALGGLIPASHAVYLNCEE